MVSTSQGNSLYIGATEKKEAKIVGALENILNTFVKIWATFNHTHFFKFV